MPAKNVTQIPPLAQTAVAQAPKACLAVIGGSSNTAADAARLGRSAAGFVGMTGGAYRILGRRGQMG